MKRPRRRTSMRGLLISLFAAALLILPASVCVQGAPFPNQIPKAKEDTVLVPLVDYEEDTAIPVNPFSFHVSIRLISPPGKELHVPLADSKDDHNKPYVAVLIVYKGSVSSDKIFLQDWPQIGPVLPLSQDWPQGGLLLIPILNEPDKDYLCIEIEQDWPQDMIPGILI